MIWTISDALNDGWQLMKQNFVLFLLILLTLFGLDVLSVLGDKLGIKLFVFVIVIVAGIIFDIGLTRITLDVVDGKRVQYKQLYAYPQFFPDYLLASVLYVLIVIVGLVLLIVPGIIWATKFSLYKYYIVDKKMGPFAALKASAKATYGHKWHLFLFWLTAIGVNLLGLLCVIVGLLVTIPTTEIAGAYIYRAIADEKVPRATNPQRAAQWRAAGVVKRKTQHKR